MAHLIRMHRMRQDQMFEIEDDNEFDRVKQVVIQRQKLKEKLDQVHKDADKLTDIEYKKNLKSIERQKQTQKNDVIMHLKRNFKHINGMWPKTANFRDEEDRLQSWQTSLVIKKKIFKPSKRIVVCQQGV